MCHMLRLQAHSTQTDVTTLTALQRLTAEGTVTVRQREQLQYVAGNLVACLGCLAVLTVTGTVTVRSNDLYYACGL